MDACTLPCAVLTREPADNARLAAGLRAAGVPVVEVPCLHTRWLAPPPLPEAPAAVVFTSRRGVRGLRHTPRAWERLLPPRGRPLVAAVGPATAAALRAAGAPADVEAEPPTGGALARALLPLLPPAAQVIVVRGLLQAGGLDEALAAAGHAVLSVPVYSNEAPPLPTLAPFPVAAVLLASPSAGERLLAALPWLLDAPLLAGGPTTAAALRALGATDVHDVGTGHDRWLAALLAATEHDRRPAAHDEQTASGRQTPRSDTDNE